MSKEFEAMAFQEVQAIQSDHMMFLLLNLPLPNHEGRCLIQIAQESSRVTFLNNERVGDVINHMYSEGNLKPTDRIRHKPLTFAQMFWRVFFHPFRFYLSPQGYHHCGSILYVEYLLLLFTYAYVWPSIPTSGVQGWKPIWIALEIVFWCSNFGYILFECFEYNEKGARQYFNLAVMGDANIMDAFVSVSWLFLFAIRIIILNLFGHNVGDRLNNYYLEQAYGFLFGFQILFMTIRSFKFANNSQYFGSLLRIIKLMMQETFKFLSIFVMMMIGVSFGLWFICGVGEEESNFWGNDQGIWSGFLHVFEIFISTKEISEFELDTTAIIYLVIATVIGTLILLNLLIALMTTT